MVYEKKCSECGKIMDFGGADPEEDDFTPDGLPDDATRFNGDLYCRECVNKFVEFGTGSLMERMESLEQNLDDIRKELGMEKNLNT
ncbi:MAG: hypothetical protein BRC29_02915 [Nanohaloarchaea archaeon SW_7_43_1]|nr:MAG: hypothetical protein BRC29_02915 [Nanohaloarchaea archaeon SW_7_43_1]